MATLDNFATVYGPGSRARQTSYADRLRNLQYNLPDSAARGWDLRSALPVAPVQPYDPGMRTSERPSPLIEERRTPRGMQGYFVPLVPRPQRRVGDTADGVLLYDARGNVGAQWLRRTTAPVRTYSRFHPYV